MKAIIHDDKTLVYVAIEIVKELSDFKDIAYIVNEEIYQKEVIKENLLYAVKILLTLYSTFDAEPHFPYYIYYFIEEIEGSIKLVFKSSNYEDGKEIINNTKYTLL